MILYKQLSLADIFTDCQNKFNNDKYNFLSTLEEGINLDGIVQCLLFLIFTLPPAAPRKHLLYPTLKALLLQLNFSISIIPLLIAFKEGANLTCATGSLP